MPKIVFNKPDIPNMASKLPRPLQQPVGALAGLVNAILGGDDPVNSMMGAATPLTTIGPGSFPLSNPLSRTPKPNMQYMGHAAGRTLEDMTKSGLSLDPVIGDLPRTLPLSPNQAGGFEFNVSEQPVQWATSLRAKDLANKKLGAPTDKLSELVQSLSDYFAQGKYDPFK